MFLERFGVVFRQSAGHDAGGKLVEQAVIIALILMFPK